MVLAKKLMNQYRIWIICIVAFLIVPLFKPAFLTVNNIEGILTSMVTYGVIALGLTMTLITGEINISIGAVMAFSSVTFAVCMKSLPIVVSMVLALAGAAVFGLVDGYFVAYKKLPAFMVSVAVMVTVRGIALAVSGEAPVGIMSDTIAKIGRLQIAHIPVLFLFLLLCVLILELFLKRTQVGRNMYAVGGAPEVAAAYGLNVEKYKCLSLTFCSFMAGVGGILLAIRMCSGSPSVGEDAMPSVLPMIVIGGTSISGGKGGMIKTLSGIVLMNLIFNIMSMFNIYVNVQNLIKGGILLVIVITDRYLENRNKKI
ncbi:MAG: ABC transporter permease [Lachnospiraceae bacterium]|nr:ABC transporter permease [Lachnospiraceae bacterium]